MKAGVLHEYGAAPVFGEFAEPVAGPGQVVVEMAAAALRHAERLRASGTFYLDRPELPVALGSDGVGQPADGGRVFFDAAVAPHGAFAERALVQEETLIDRPDGLDDATAAALANTGMAAWLALSWRAD